DEGRLTPRKQANAVNQSFELIEEQVFQLSQQGTQTTESGQSLAVHANTIFVHGDGSHAVEAVKRFRAVVDGAPS
ncbi:LamB/YcsF family protein, partial [Marinomonas arenicola]